MLRSNVEVTLHGAAGTRVTEIQPKPFPTRHIRTGRPDSTPLPPITPNPPLPESKPEVEVVLGAAENIRVYLMSHLGEKDKLIRELGPDQDDHDIFARAQSYANRTGYLVNCVRHEPHLIKKFRPAVWRESLDTPPIIDPQAPPETELKGLGWFSHSPDSAMFFDDRMQKGRRRFKRRNRDNVIAWLNKSKYGRNIGEAGYYLNVVKKDVFVLTKPIPRQITQLGSAIEWVLYHSEWRCPDA